MSHHMQRKRKQNLDFVAKLVEGKDAKKVDRQKLANVIMLNKGATREKAHEYIRIVLGDEE